MSHLPTPFSLAMGRQIKMEGGLNSVKSGLDDKTKVDRNLSVVSSPTKRQHVKDEDIKDESTPKRQKFEENSDELDVKQEDIEDAKNATNLSYKSENTPDIKPEDTAEVDVKSEDAPILKPACKDDDKMVNIKLEYLPDLPNGGSPYVTKRDEMAIKVEDLQDAIVQSIEEAGHFGIKAEDAPILKADSSEDIYNDSTSGSRAESYTTPESDSIFHRIRWHGSATEGRIIASPSRSPLALSSPAESPIPSGERPSSQPTPDFSTLSSPEPDPESSDEANSSDSDSDGYDADISEISSSWDSDSDDSDDSDYSPDSDQSDSDSDSSDDSGTPPSTRSSTTDATSPSPSPDPVPYVSPFTAPNLFYRDFYPTPVARRPGAAGPKIRFYRKNFFNRPKMILSSRS